MEQRALVNEVCRRSGKTRVIVEAVLGLREHPTGRATPRTMALVRAALREIRNEQGQLEASDGPQ